MQIENQGGYTVLVFLYKQDAYSSALMYNIYNTLKGPETAGLKRYERRRQEPAAVKEDEAKKKKSKIKFAAGKE